MRGAALVLAMVMVAGAAQAQRVSNVNGKTLMKTCTGAATESCDAYVDGFGDAIEEEGKANAVACIPRSVTGPELRDVLVKFLKDHPEDQHLTAGAIAKRRSAKPILARNNSHGVDSDDTFQTRSFDRPTPKLRQHQA